MVTDCARDPHENFLFAGSRRVSELGVMYGEGRGINFVLCCAEAPLHVARGGEAGDWANALW